MLLPELPRGDLIPFFERTDQVAAVCKAGLGGNQDLELSTCEYSVK